MVRRIVDEIANLASSLGANHTTIATSADNAGEFIVVIAEELGAGMVIVSGTSRTGSGDLFLGHAIHHVLEQFHCTVLVAVAPSPKRAPAAGIDDVASADTPDTSS